MPAVDGASLRAPMLATQLALGPMRAAGGGAIVNVASTAGLGNEPYVSPEYGAAKAGLIRFTSTLGVLELIRDDSLAGRSLLLLRGEPPRLI